MPPNPAHVCLLRAWNELFMAESNRLSTAITDEAGPIMTIHSYRRDVVLANAMTVAHGPPSERAGLLRALAKDNHTKSSIEEGLAGASSRMGTNNKLELHEQVALFTSNESSSSITGATCDIATVGAPRTTPFTKAPQRVLVHNSQARQFTGLFH